MAASSASIASWTSSGSGGRRAAAAISPFCGVLVRSSSDFTRFSRRPPISSAWFSIPDSSALSLRFSADAELSAGWVSISSAGQISSVTSLEMGLGGGVSSAMFPLLPAH